MGSKCMKGLLMDLCSLIRIPLLVLRSPELLEPVLSMEPRQSSSWISRPCHGPTLLEPQTRCSSPSLQAWTLQGPSLAQLQQSAVQFKPPRSNSPFLTQQEASSSLSTSLESRIRSPWTLLAVAQSL
jgi:hypothetical protein